MIKREFYVKQVRTFYNLYGYRIEDMDGNAIYEAGNYAFESSTCVDPRGETALALSEIKRFAIQAAKEYGDIAPSDPTYDAEEETSIAQNRGDDDLASDVERLRAL